MNSVLIIAHRYIPYTGVNGIRWINLAKELALLGYDVSVITVSRKGISHYDLTQNVNINAIISNPFPIHRILEYKATTLGAKILKGVLTKVVGMIIKDDYADCWFKSLDAIVKDFLDSKPNTVLIGTGAPFQACYHAAVLGKKYNLKTIVDFQDPWFNDALSKTNIKLEEYREACYSYIKANCETRVYVTSGLKKHYKDASTGSSFVIENAHGFYGMAVKDCEPQSNNRFLYLGTLANGRDSAFIEWITKLNEGDLIDVHVIIDVYGRVSERFKLFLKNNNTTIKVNLKGYVAQNEIAIIAKHYSAALQINANEYPYLVSTKIYEYPALGLPTLSINYGGDINYLITKNKIGISELIGRPQKPLSITLDALSRIHSSDLDRFSKNNSWKSRAVEFSILLDNLADAP